MDRCVRRMIAERRTALLVTRVTLSRARAVPEYIRSRVGALEAR